MRAYVDAKNCQRGSCDSPNCEIQNRVMSKNDETQENKNMYKIKEEVHLCNHDAKGIFRSICLSRALHRPPKSFQTEQINF